MSDQLEVDIKINTEGAAEALRVWQQQQQGVQALGRELTGVQNQLSRTRDEMGKFTAGAKQAGSATAAGFEAGSNALKDFAVGITGIGSAVGGALALVDRLKTEYEDMKRREKDAASAQLSVAAAQRETLATLGNDPDLSADQLVKRVEAISKDTGAGQGGVYRAVNTALGFGGADMSKERMIEAAEMAVQMSPDDEATAQANTKALLTIMRANKGVSAKDAMGFMMAGKQFSPTVTEEAFGSNIAPTVGKLQQFGDSAEGAMSLLAAAGQGIGDEEGRVTANAMINLAQQLAEQPELAGIEGGTLGRMDALQRPEFARVRERLLGVFDKEAKSKKKAGLTGESKAFTTMISFLNQEGAGWETLKATREQMPQLAGAGSKVDEFNQVLARQPLQQQAMAERVFRQGTEEAKIADLKGGRRSIGREGLDAILAAQNSGDWDRALERMNYDAGATGVSYGDAAQQLRARAGQLTYRLDWTGQRQIYSPVSEDAPRQAEQLIKMAERLEKLVKLQEEATAAQKQIADKAKAPNPEVAVPPAQQQLGRRP